MVESNPMNLRTLHYLVAIADTQHFGQAAERCHVSQPTLSMQVKKFEEQLNIMIFERNNKSVILTDIGHDIIAKARQVLTHMEDLRQIAHNAQDPYATTLKLGIIPTLAPYLLPKIMPHLNDAYPKLTLYLIEQQTAVLSQQLQTGEIDAALMALPIASDTLTHTPLLTENFFLAVHKDHALSGQASINTKDLTTEPILLLEEGHCLRDQALEVCQINQTFQPHDFKATSLETLRQMVASRVGVTLMPELACSNTGDQLSYVPFEQPSPSRTIALFWRKTSSQTALFNALANAIRGYL